MGNELPYLLEGKDVQSTQSPQAAEKLVRIIKIKLKCVLPQRSTAALSYGDFVINLQ